MLQFIKETVCPICGCNIISNESVEVERDRFGKYHYRTHCSGGTWETRKFACSYELGYMPSCKETTVIHKCENDPEVILLREKTKISVSRIKACIEHTGLDKDTKNHLINSLIITLGVY